MAERLTKQFMYGLGHKECCDACAVCDVSGCCDVLEEMLEKLAHYEDLEEQGKLIKLPCKIGDTVWEVQETRKRIQEYTVISVHHSHCSTLFGWTLKDGEGVYSNLNGFEEHAIGKTVFLTKEEAEAALKGAEE